MGDHTAAYNSQADQYECLVAHEDYQGNIVQAINQIRPLAGLDVIDLGAGTGRLTRLVAPFSRSIVVLDISPHMLRVAQAKLKQNGWSHWRIAAADHRRLPVKSHIADVLLAGWTIGQMVAWNLATWKNEVEQTLAEIHRVLRPGGTVIILETLGTGRATPQPNPKLIGYTTYLERVGFSSTCIRTDFEFESLDQTIALLGFFFGADAGVQWAAEYGTTVPECTGLWWLNV